ncbi:MAG: DHH family phosphoesterase, partial [Cellulosilyticaceae bacterium]
MDLNKLLDYDEIVIQCHDNPDADAIGSGFALYTYLQTQGKDVRLIYGGHFKIAKPNLLLMLEHLHIPLIYVQELEKTQLLVTVDCQVKGGNVAFFDATTFAEIDHHVPTGSYFELSDIRPNLGSCATLIWDLLRHTDFDLTAHPHVSTALYYGLFTDTNFLTELRHPLDRDMLDAIYYDAPLIRLLKNSNLGMSDLEIAGMTLIRCSTNKNHKFAVLESKPCDPNVLGFISDLAIQVNGILVCIVYFENAQGIKFSVRSCTNEVKANEFASYVANHIGSGGGHIDKAGGFISAKAFEEHYHSTNIETYFHNITREYFESYDIIRATTYDIDITNMPTYVKRPVVVGYMPSTALFASGSPLCIRTLEGDVDFTASPDVYIMVGIEGEAQPIRREKFEKSYITTDDAFDISFSYTPVVKHKLSGETLEIAEFIQPCVASG